MTDLTRRCIDCGKVQSIDAFSVDPVVGDGTFKRCYTCRMRNGAVKPTNTTRKKPFAIGKTWCRQCHRFYTTSRDGLCPVCRQRARAME